LDCSTQGFKASLIRLQTTEEVGGVTVTVEQTQTQSSYSVNFDSDLPQFETNGGCHKHSDERTVTAPTLMWVAALELLFDRMKKDGVPFESIAAISGAGQQHGSVYWSRGLLTSLFVVVLTFSLWLDDVRTPTALVDRS